MTSDVGGMAMNEIPSGVRVVKSRNALMWGRVRQLLNCPRKPAPYADRVAASISFQWYVWHEWISRIDSRIDASDRLTQGQ